jgi:hypothetical protein
MSIVEQQLVDIEIVTSPGQKRANLQLNYQGETYHLCQAFAMPKLAQAQAQWQQLRLTHGERYLLVREVGYYSLWESDSDSLKEQCPDRSDRAEVETQLDRSASLQIEELRQASLCFFQELWLRLNDLIGTRQLQFVSNNLLTIVPHLKSSADVDRLLDLDSERDRLTDWAEAELIRFDRELYQLAQKKLGKQFASELIVDIITSMPDRLRLKLEQIFNN